jgi:hypothetical protein
MSPDTRISASCSPDVVGIVRDIRAILRDGMHHSPLVAEQAMREAADALESMMRERDALREALTYAAETTIDEHTARKAFEALKAMGGGDARAALSDGIEQKSDTD